MFAEFGRISMNLSMDCKIREQSLIPELCFLCNHPTPTPLNPAQNADLANFGPILNKLGVEVKYGEESSNVVIFSRVLATL